MVKEEKDDDEEAKKESEGRNRQAIITEKKFFYPLVRLFLWWELQDQGRVHNVSSLRNG